MSKLDDFIHRRRKMQERQALSFKYVKQHELDIQTIHLATAVNKDIKELTEKLNFYLTKLLKDSNIFSSLEQLQEEFSVLHSPKVTEKPYIPGQRVIHSKYTAISGAALLQKAKQMQKEHRTIIKLSAHSSYNYGISAGIDRIIKLIERHYKK